MLFPFAKLGDTENVWVPAPAGEAIVASNVGDVNVIVGVQNSLKLIRSEAAYVPVVVKLTAVIGSGFPLPLSKKLCIGTDVDPAQTVAAGTELFPIVRLPPASVNVAWAFNPEVWPIAVTSSAVLRSSSLNTCQVVAKAPLVSAETPQGAYTVPAAGPAVCST